MFQGGFVGQQATIVANTIEGDGTRVDALTHLMAFYPNDVNGLQDFSINGALNSNIILVLIVTADAQRRLDKMRIQFNNGSTDFYGRVIIYRLNLHGQIDA